MYEAEYNCLWTAIAWTRYKHNVLVLEGSKIEPVIQLRCLCDIPMLVGLQCLQDIALSIKFDYSAYARVCVFKNDPRLQL